MANGGPDPGDINFRTTCLAEHQHNMQFCLSNKQTKNSIDAFLAKQREMHFLGGRDVLSLVDMFSMFFGTSRQMLESCFQRKIARHRWWREGFAKDLCLGLCDWKENIPKIIF